MSPIIPGGFDWVDGPAGGTPLDAFELNAEQTALKAYVDLRALRTANASDFADTEAAKWNLAVQVFTAKAAATTNLPLSGLAAVDGFTPSATGTNGGPDIILATGQTTSSQNGLWSVNAGAWTRPSRFPAGGVIARSCEVTIGGGSNPGTVWVLPVTTPVTIDTTAQSWTIQPVTVGALPASVPLKTTANTFTASQVINSPSVNADGLLLTLPALDGVTGLGGLRMIDVAGNAGKMIQLNHFGSAGLYPYALDISNRVGAGTALAIHQYSNVTPAVQLDATTNVAMIQLKEAENPTLAPGTHGTAAFLQLHGYYVPGVTAADGVVSGGTTLTSASAAFVAEDVLKAITVAGVSNVIAGFVNATTVTLQNAATNGSGITYSYVRRGDIAQMAQLDNQLSFVNYGTSTFRFTTNTGQVPALRVEQTVPSALPTLYVLNGGGTGATVNVTTTSGSGAAINVYNAGTGNALSLVQAGTGAAVNISAQAAAAGSFPLYVTGQDYGPYFSTATNGGTTLTVAKGAAGAGTALLITNAGTGLSLDVASKFQILASGQIKFALAGNEATGAGSAALGANSPAVTNTAPYTWEKVVTSDGSAGFIPVWK